MQVKEFLSRKGIAFKEYDVAKDERARKEMFLKTGRLAVPTLVVNGRVAVGYNPEELESLLREARH